MKFVVIPPELENYHRSVLPLLKQLNNYIKLADKKYIPPLSLHMVDIKKHLKGCLLLPENRIIDEDRLNALNWYLETETKELFKKIGFNYYSSSRSIPLLVLQASKKTTFLFSEIKGDKKLNFTLLKDVIDLYNMLTVSGYLIDQLYPEDFLYTERGEIKYFISLYKISFSNLSCQNIFINNIYSFFCLLDEYLQKLYFSNLGYEKNKMVDRIYQDFIVPIIYNSSSAKDVEFMEPYGNFSDLKKIFQKESYNEDSKKTGVFLDTANILRDKGQKMVFRIKFDKLFSQIYGLNYISTIKTRQAVLFQPFFTTEEKNIIAEEYLQKTEEYLRKYNFDVHYVKNGTARARTEVDGEYLDVDDQQLIQIMNNNFKALDRILLFTGNKDFRNIARKYKKAGKEVKIIAFSQKSTDKYLKNNFDLSYISDYYDCVYYQRG